MMNRGLLLLAVLMSAGALLYSFISVPRTGYIEIQEVYQKFDLKKELEKKYNSVTNERKRITDSLELDLKLLDTRLRTQKAITDAQAEEFEGKRQVFIQKYQQFEEDNKRLSEQYDREILEQLNQYVKDYGIENNYDYIYGNDNNGSLMHADDKRNLTSAVIQFINEKFKGIK